jgi:hypothetical protein
VIWRAHMMLPCTYKSDFLRLQGVGNESKGVSMKTEGHIVPYINACPAWSWDAQGARAREALMHTKDVYVKTFGEPYVTAGSAFSAPLNQIPPHSNSSSQNEGMNGKRNGRAGGTKGLGGNEIVPDLIRPTNSHRALLTNTSFQIVIDLVGPFGTCAFVPIALSFCCKPIDSTTLLTCMRACMHHTAQRQKRSWQPISLAPCGISSCLSKKARAKRRERRPCDHHMCTLARVLARYAVVT